MAKVKKIRKDLRFSKLKARHIFLSSFFEPDGRLKTIKYINYMTRKYPKLDMLKYDHVQLLIELMDTQHDLINNYGDYVPDNWITIPEPNRPAEELYKIHFYELVEYLGVYEQMLKERDEVLKAELEEAISTLDKIEIKDENNEPQSD